MTRLDWSKRPEIDPARMQRESLGNYRKDEEVITLAGRKPRRVVGTPQNSKGPRLGFDEAVRKMPSFQKNLANRIRFIQLAGKKDCDAFIHETAILVSLHAARTGDCSRALSLAKAMPSARRRDQLVSWFRQTGPIRINLSGDRVGLCKADRKDFRPYDFEAAKRKPFFDF